MRRVVVVVILLFVVGRLYSREVVNINKDWRFFSHSEGTSDRAQSVNLPHMWNNDALSGRNDYFRGVGNYMKEIAVPKEWKTKRTYIRFGGAGTVASVIVNGRYVGEHKGGYTAFAFELTPFLKYGENNTIWVTVNNSPRQDVLPTAGDMNIYGGLYRSVDLIVTETSHIAVDDHAAEGVYVHQRKVLQEEAELEAVVKINAPAGKMLTLNLAIETPNRDTVAVQTLNFKVPEGGVCSVSLPVKVANPTLWDGIENPYRYTVRVRLVDETTVYDETTVPLGMRFFSVDPKQGFMLNGRPYRIRGVVHYEDRAAVGLALQSYQIKEDLDLITEMGANAVRAAGYPHNQTFYEECDRRGIIVWSEIPFLGPAYMTDRGYIHNEEFRQNGRAQLNEMLAQQFNHPSIMMWGIFSDQDIRGDDPTEYVKELNTNTMQEDPSRMTVATSNQDGAINQITDLIVWDHVYGWKEGLPGDLKVWIAQLQKNWGSLCSGISYGAGASIYHQEDSLYRPNYLGNWHPERWQTALHEQYFPMVNESPFLWGWFVANMFDYGAAGRDWGEGIGVDDRGLMTFDRKYRKDAFYFYKANWNRSTPMIHIAEKRWTPRSKSKQTLRVYSNSAEVELVVNGVSLGTKSGINSTFVWEGVQLNPGNNNVEARSPAGIDYTDIEVL